MIITHRNLKKGLVILKVESLDDLWHISQLVNQNDIVKGLTSYKIKIGDERKQSVVRKTILVSLQVERIEFHKYSNALRIFGAVKEGPEDIKVGSQLSLEVTIDTVITIIKEAWLNYELKRLEEASKKNRFKILICILERGEACFAILKKYGFDYLGELQGEVEKKRYKQNLKESDFYGDVIKKLVEYDKRFNLDRLILASPAFYKDDLVKDLEKKHPELMKKLVKASCNDFGEKGIEEVLKRDETRKILKEERIIREVGYVEDFFKCLAQNKPVTYGVKNVKLAAESNAVDKLLITDKKIHEERKKDNYAILENLLKTVDKSKGEIHIISADHESGKKLQGIGGIAATLRFRIS